MAIQLMVWRHDVGVPENSDPAAQFDKAKSTGRIDALVALAMALSLTLLWQCRDTISDSANSSVRGLGTG
jgi:hypothetical protein